MSELTDAAYRFKPELLKAAKLSLKEAQFLRWIFLEERSNAEVFTEFGGGFGYQILRHGYATNPLGVKGISHTNLWKLTQAGRKKLNEAIGEKIA
jgi:hypothetical protein